MTETTEQSYEMDALQELEADNVTDDQTGDALFEFKAFVMGMSVAAYEEGILQFGMTKRDAKELCIPTKLGKEFKFKCYQPKPGQPSAEVDETINTEEV